MHKSGGGNFTLRSGIRPHNALVWEQIHSRVGGSVDVMSERLQRFYVSRSVVIVIVWLCNWQPAVALAGASSP
jgi:hypothetical protein